MRIITLTTDFGLTDPFVGVMKGIILSIAPESTIVDLTHAVSPQDIVAGALAVESAVGYFPPGTIHVAVVDPGVGSERPSIAVETNSAIYVGPDNGLFTLALARQSVKRMISVENPRYFLPEVSATFHGRDMFAPVAAHLSTGIRLEALGPSLDGICALELPGLVIQASRILSEVLSIDRFGNLVTGITLAHLSDWNAELARITVAGAEAGGIHTTYSEVEAGSPLAYIGSGGRLEIGIRNGSAAQVFGAGRGTIIEVIRG